MGLGSGRLAIVPEQLKGFLEVPSPHDRQVQAHQRGQPLLLVSGEVPGILQEQPTGAFELCLLFPDQAPHLAPPHLVHSFVQVLDDMEPVKQDLSIAGVFLHQVRIGGPHVHAYHAQRRATPSPHRLGEERLDRLFGPVFPHPEQDPSLQVVDHREVNLPFPPADFIDANHMHRRTLALPQPVLHRPAHNPGYGLPVQPILPRRSLPAEFPRQPCHRVAQGARYPRPRLGPRKILHSYPTARTVYPSWPITQNQRRLSHRQVSPLPLFPNAMHVPAPAPAYPATQQPRSQTVDGNCHLLPILFHLRHPVSFQSQLFSDKRLDEHLVPVPFCGLSNSESIQIGVLFFSSIRSFPKAVLSTYTFGTGTLFAFSLVHLAGATQRLAGWMTFFGATILMTVSLIEITFYISALHPDPATMPSISLIFISAVQHLYFIVAAPALFLP